MNLEGLTHQQKLAFWINIYNSCMMNVRYHPFTNESKVLKMSTQECTFSIKFWDIEWLRKVLYLTGIEY